MIAILVALPHLAVYRYGTILGDTFSNSNHPNLHLAIEAYTTAPERSFELIGISGERLLMMAVIIGSS